MTKVLNGRVRPGDTVAYSTRKRWEMATRIGVVIRAGKRSILVRVTLSSDGNCLTRLVRIRELKRVVKVGA